MRRGNRGTAATDTSPGRPGQLPLPLGKPKSPSEVEAVTIGRRVVVVRLVRHKRSRRYVLRVLSDGTVRVTIPRSGSRAAAFAFLRRELPWVERQRYTVARGAGTVLFRGVPFPLVVDDQCSPGRRTVRFAGDAVVVRPGETVRAAACRRLRDVASQELKGRLLAIAARLDLAVKRVVIRSQQTRWGSCSPAGAIALNWRLVQMPHGVCDYILVHELMHLRIRNHSRRFWTLVEHACPDYRAARRWLKDHEGELA